MEAKTNDAFSSAATNIVFISSYLSVKAILIRPFSSCPATIIWRYLKDWIREFVRIETYDEAKKILFVLVTIDPKSPDMKLFMHTDSFIKHKIKRGNEDEPTEEKKQELIKLQTRIAELENELKRQRASQKQNDKAEDVWGYDFNTDWLF